MLIRNPHSTEFNLPAPLFAEPRLFRLERLLTLLVVNAFDPVAVRAQQLVSVGKRRVFQHFDISIPASRPFPVLIVYLKTAGVRATTGSIGVKPLAVRTLAAASKPGDDLFSFFYGRHPSRIPPIASLIMKNPSNTPPYYERCLFYSPTRPQGDRIGTGKQQTFIFRTTTGETFYVTKTDLLRAKRQRQLHACCFPNWRSGY